MPAQFEIIYPDKTVSFFVPTRAGEPLYIGRDAAGVMSLSPDGTGDPFAMLLEDEKGVVEVSAFEPDHVLLDGAPMQGTQRLASYAEIRIDDHTFIVLSDGAPANERSSSEAPPLAAPAHDRPRVFVTDVRMSDNRNGMLVYTVTVRTSGSEAAYEPKVNLQAEVGRLQDTFIPLTEAQQRYVMPTFPHGDTLNMQRSETQIVELQVRLEQSSLVQAGDYRLRVTASFEREPYSPDAAAEALLTVPAFSKFRVDDPLPTRHVFPRYLGRPAAKSILAITNEGNVVTSFTVQAENAPNSDCRATLILLPRSYTPRSNSATLRDRIKQITSKMTPQLPVVVPRDHSPVPALPDTGTLERSSQPQQLRGLDIRPDETRHVQVSLVAQGQPYVSLRHSHHQVNVSVSEQSVSPISKSIRLVTVPLLIGPLRVLLVLLALALVLSTHVAEMNDKTGLLVDQACPEGTITLGDQRRTLISQENVALTICSLPFTDVKLEKRAFNATPEISAITEVSKTIGFVADRSVSYRLIATHPLGRLLPWPPFIAQRSIDFDLSVSGMPTGTWEVQPLSVPKGGEVTVFWNNVDQAKRLTLYENGAPNVIPVDSIYAGQMKFPLAYTTIFSLEAVSETGERKVWTQVVNVDVPEITPTPLPLPVITRFDVSPAQVVSGQPVLLQWEVAGPPDALTVTLMTNGVPAIVPASAVIYQLPQSDANGMRIYELIAYNGRDFASAMRQVQVLLPTLVPTPTPGPVGVPDFDLACGGTGRADLRQLGERWVWVCLDNPLADISSKVCRDQYGDTAYAKAGNPGLKQTWMCWR